MARKKQTPVTQEDARTIGALLRGLRRAAGLGALQDAADATGCPALTIPAYHVTTAWDLVSRLQPPAPRKR